jgi:hypothetical protein
MILRQSVQANPEPGNGGNPGLERPRKTILVLIVCIPNHARSVFLGERTPSLANEGKPGLGNEGKPSLGNEGKPSLEGKAEPGEA